MSYLLHIGLLVILLIVLLFRNQISTFENFETEPSESESKFFTIRSKEVKNLNNLLKNTRIGFSDQRDVELFKRILNAIPIPKNVSDSLNYVKVVEIDYDKMDLFIETNVLDETVKDYVVYYDNKSKIDQEYEMVFVNNNYTFLIKDVHSNKQPRYKFFYESEKQGIGTDTTFVISGKFGGTYKQVSQTLDEIILKTPKIDGVKVEEGDTVFIKKQDVEKMNGVYTVKSVGRNTIMHKKVKAKDLEYVCIDEDLKEQTSYRTEYSCENELDAVGKKKPIKMHWDKRCVRDFECPWYKEDSKYGCSSGYCQTPEGVRQVSYRYYEGMDKPKTSLKVPTESKIDVDFTETNITIAPNVPYFEYNLDEFRTKMSNIEISKDFTNEQIVKKLNEQLNLERKYRLIHSIKVDDTDAFVIHRRGKPFGFYVSRDKLILTVKGILMDETIFELIESNDL